MTGLARYVHAVDSRIDEVVDAHQGFHPHQRALLHATIAAARTGVAGNPLGHPLSVLYLVARACGRNMDDHAVHVGAFCLLYVLSLDLFDDVQDDDLRGKPHEEAGPAIAINSALTLNFLAMGELRLAMELEADAERAAAYFELYNRVSIAAVTGQHRDLLGAHGAITPDQVLAMQQAKTSCLELLTECGSLLGLCDEAIRGRYRGLGERMAQFIQIRDDLRDLFGKPYSPDLATGKVTYPVACLLEAADEKTRSSFVALKAELPESMQALRTFLYRSGAVEASAAMLEDLRAQIHDGIAAMDFGKPYHRTLLDVIDSLASGVYRPAPIADTAALWSPEGRWHEEVRVELARFTERMAPFGTLDAPTLRPWHLPHWLYVPERETIYYPDIEGLQEETLPFHSALLGCEALDEVISSVRLELCAVLAHEMFHRWRAVSGRLTGDKWHEEWAANRLAVAYCRRFDPDTLAHVARLAERVVVRHGGLSPAQEAVLSGANRARSTEAGYAMDAVSAAVVGFEMVRRLIVEAPLLESTVSSLLGPSAVGALSA